MDFSDKGHGNNTNPEEKTMGKDEFNVFLKIYFELVLDVFRNQTNNICLLYTSPSPRDS